MATKIEIPKELLAQIDFANTVNGGMVEFKGVGGRYEDGYRLTIEAPSVSKDLIHIETANQRFLVYYLIDVLDGEGQMPFFLVNMPLAPDADVNKMTARFDDGKIYIRAPFNEWGKGVQKNIDLE
jgi:HSP20 family protein